MTVAWIRHDPSASALRYAYIREDVANMLLLPADNKHAILSHGNNAYKRSSKIAAMKYERRDLPNVLLVELARLSHALPILRCTNGAVSNIRALYVNLGASEALIVVNAIGRAFIARNGTWVGTVHEHKRIRTGLKTANRDKRPVMLRAIFLSANNDCAVMLCGAAKQHHRTTGCE
jgi:hypothetical protein